MQVSSRRNKRPHFCEQIWNQLSRQFRQLRQFAIWASRAANPIVTIRVFAPDTRVKFFLFLLWRCRKTDAKPHQTDVPSGVL